MKKSQLRPIFQKHPWIIRPAAAVAFLVSPILVPVFVTVSNRDQISSIYEEIFQMLFGKLEEE